MTKVISTSIISLSTKTAPSSYCIGIIDCKLTSNTITSFSIFIYDTVTCSFNLTTSGTFILTFWSFISNCKIIFSVFVSSYTFRFNNIHRNRHSYHNLIYLYIHLQSKFGHLHQRSINHHNNHF